MLRLASILNAFGAAISVLLLLSSSRINSDSVPLLSLLLYGFSQFLDELSRTSSVKIHWDWWLIVDVDFEKDIWVCEGSDSWRIGVIWLWLGEFVVVRWWIAVVWWWLRRLGWMMEVVRVVEKEKVVVRIGYGGWKWWRLEFVRGERKWGRKNERRKTLWFFVYFVKSVIMIECVILTMTLTYIGDVVDLGPIGVGHVALDL
jgi:hypothetical protein